MKLIWYIHHCRTNLLVSIIPDGPEPITICNGLSFGNLLGDDFNSLYIDIELNDENIADNNILIL